MTIDELIKTSKEGIAVTFSAFLAEIFCLKI